MVAMKALIAILPFFLSVTTAIPQDPATSHLLAPIAADENTSSENNVDFATSMAEGEATNDDSDRDWNVSAADGEVIVNFYKDKNPDKNVKIDPKTCKGNAEIALMKWRSNCKAFNAIFRKSCYTDAPSEEKCCPLAKEKSCDHYWPAEGE